jgi:hypothetical protein
MILDVLIECKVITNDRNWWKVRNEGGQEGYVPKTYLQTLKGASVDTLVFDLSGVTQYVAPPVADQAPAVDVVDSSVPQPPPPPPLPPSLIPGVPRELPVASNIAASGVAPPPPTSPPPVRQCDLMDANLTIRRSLTSALPRSKIG